VIGVTKSNSQIEAKTLNQKATHRKRQKLSINFGVQNFLKKNFFLQKLFAVILETYYKRILLDINISNRK